MRNRSKLPIWTEASAQLPLDVTVSSRHVHPAIIVARIVRHQFLACRGVGENGRRAYGDGFAGAHNLTSGDESIALRWSEQVDLVFDRQPATSAAIKLNPPNRTRCPISCLRCGVQKTMLLRQLGTVRQGDFDEAGFNACERSLRSWPSLADARSWRERVLQTVDLAGKNSCAALF